MELRTNPGIILKQFGQEYDSTKVFFAEKIIVDYLNKIPEEWDEGLSLVTCEIVKRMELDTGIKSEGDDGHSVTYRDIKNINELLGTAIIAVLDTYTDTPKVTPNNSFSII